MWFKDVSPAERKAETSKKVLSLLPDDGSEVSWTFLSESAKECGIGEASLSRHLKTWVKIGYVKRRVDISTYPPRTFYRKLPELSRNDKEKLSMAFKVMEVEDALANPPSTNAPLNEILDWVSKGIEYLTTSYVYTLIPISVKGVEKGDENFVRKLYQEALNEISYKTVDFLIKVTKICSLSEDKAAKIRELFLLKFAEQKEKFEAFLTREEKKGQNTFLSNTSHVKNCPNSTETVHEKIKSNLG
jgi:DNA-binding transcriptional ArsR family regulator